MASTTSTRDVWEDDEPTSMGARFPVYKQMGVLDVATNGDGPIVAMAKLIQDDAEVGGSYILRLGDRMTVTIDVDVLGA